MMKTYTLIFVALLFSAITANAQWASNSTWSYNFGTRANAIEYVVPTPAANIWWSNPLVGSNLFAATAPTSDASLGIGIHNQCTNGKITLGTDNSLTLLMGQVSQFVRFSTTNINTVAQGGVSTSIVRHSFTLTIGNSNVGNLLFGFGTSTATGSGLFAYNGGNLNALNNSIFGAIRLSYGGAGNDNVILTRRQSSTATNASITDGATAFKKGGTYNIQVYANNSGEATDKTYTAPDATSRTLSNGTIHIWVSDVSVIPAVWTRYITVKSTDDGIATAAPLNAFTFQAFGNASATAGAEFTISNLELSYATDATTLPVSLTSFSGKTLGKNVLLNWITVSEQNNSHFDLLRSADGKDFSVVGTVTGNGTTSETKNYSFTDTNPFDGLSYYKLKQVDFDGKSTIFDEIVSVRTSLNKDDFTIYVNNDDLLIAKVHAAKATEAKVTVFNVAGQKILESAVKLTAGYNTLTQQLPVLQKGVYVVQLSQPNKVQQQKFFK